VQAGRRRPHEPRVQLVRDDIHVALSDVVARDEHDLRPGHEPVAASVRTLQDGLLQVSLDGVAEILERGEVGRVQRDPVAIGHEHPPVRPEPMGLHGALDAPLQLDGLRTRAEEPGRRPLQEPLEEALDGGDRPGHGAGHSG
jgi:hypothetical protein